MDRRQKLFEITQSFDLQILTSLFTSANESFQPDKIDYNFYLNDSFPNLNKLEKIGEIQFSEAERLIIISCLSEKELTSRSGKKRQYELAKRILKAEYYDAGIFVFYDETGHFRFSLVVTHYTGTRREFTSFRRYTYFVSPHLPNKTFINQISKADFSSIEKILAAFSIEAVSNDFYNAFKPKFDKLAQSVVGKVDLELKQDFALLFSIRIIFLGFVQKKGWLGKEEDFIQEFWREYQKQFNGQNKFYQDWLIPLFFEALNSPPGRKVRYQANQFSPESELIIQRAPYLNGELFKEKNGVDDLELWIPDKEIGEFLDFLFQYNFTIEENILYDEELELNPEFLGIIFERLVNKADGAVYTPRVEVDLMCRLALVKWLEKNSSCAKTDLYYLFFRESGPGTEYDEMQKQGDFTTAQIRELVGLLENVTVCDPAAGSGAFEVGMLHVLFEILENLYGRNNAPKDLKPKTPFERKQDIIAVSLYGVEVKRWAVWINHLRLWLTMFIDMPDEYRHSTEPLLPSLNFKVRRGDSLVQRIGSKQFPVQEHAHLTQDIKRSITELKKLKVDFFHNRGMSVQFVRHEENMLFRKILDAEIEEKKRELKGVIPPKGEQTGLFGREDRARQLVLKASGEQREKILAEIAELEEQKRNLKDEHPLIWNIEFAEIFFDPEKSGFDIIIGNPPYVRQEDIADPHLNLDPKEYKKALQEIVRMDFPKHFKQKMKIDGKSDLYTFFYIRSLHLLNTNGIHVFICSNSWLDVGYGTWLQYFLMKNIPMHFIIDNHARRSFARSDVNTIITVFGAPQKKATKNHIQNHLIKFVAFKQPFEDVILTENLLGIEQSLDIVKKESYRVYPVTPDKLLNEGSEFESEQKEKLGIGTYTGDKWGGKYLRAPDIYFTILEKGKEKLVKLKNVAEVRFGIKSGANDFFYVTPLERAYKTGDLRVCNSIGWEGEMEAEFLKPVIKNPRESKNIYLNDSITSFNIIFCDKPKTMLKSSKLLKYILYGESLGFNNRPSCKGRNYWYNLGNWNPAHCFWMESINDINRVYINENLKLLESDKFYGITFHSKDFVKEKCISLNSTIYMLFRELMGFHGMGEGVLKLPVKDVEEIRFINCNFPLFRDKMLNRSQNSIFEECGIDAKSGIPIYEQEPKPLPDRAELDKIVFDALGLTEEERKEVYRAVCQLVWNRISKAKSI